MRRWLATLVVLLAVAAPAAAQVAHVQTIKTIDNDGNNATTTGSLTVGSAAHLICSVLTFQSGVAADDATSVKLDNVTSFVKDKTLNANTSGTTNLRVSIWSLSNVASGSHSVSIAFPGNQSAVTVFLTEASSVATSTPLDGTGAAASGISASIATGTFTTTNSNDFWYTAVSCDCTTLTQGTGWTIPTNGSETSNVNLTGGVEYQANPGSTSGNGQFSQSGGGNDFVAVAVAYKAAAGGGGGLTAVPCTRALLGVGKCDE